ILNALTVDTFLLSCRVLGRGVEHTILRRLGEIAADRALAIVALPYYATAKNQPAHAFGESVAAEFRVDEQERVVYQIPVEKALRIVYAPERAPRDETEEEQKS